MVWGINSGSSYRESIEEDEYPARGSSRDEGHDSREYRSRGRDEGRDRYAPYPRETFDNGESSRAGHMSRDPPAVPYQQSPRPWTPSMKEGYADDKSAQYSSKAAREEYMMQYSQREREFLTRKSNNKDEYGSQQSSEKYKLSGRENRCLVEPAGEWSREANRHASGREDFNETYPTAYPSQAARNKHLYCAKKARADANEADGALFDHQLYS
ncbi:hypothetical protein B0J14DRAFT_557596 [Halenospora varia]|nr:hypothetical protein B0J14DRAFT_557596 [Halenospora varia]